MPKYLNGYFLQVSRHVFRNKTFLNLSDSAKWLYFVLKEVEHQFSGTNEDFFYRSNEDLAKDCDWNLRKLNRIKQELIASGLIQTWQMHWKDKETGKKSERHITAYRLSF